MEQAEAGSGFGSAFGAGGLRRLVVCRHSHDGEEKPQVVRSAAVQQDEPQMQQAGKADKTRQDDAVKAAEPAESNIKAIQIIKLFS